MKILQVLPALEGGGVERGTIEIAQALAQENIESVVVSSGGRLVDTLKQIGVEHIELPVHSKNPLRIIANGFRLARLLRDYKISLMHVRSRAPAWSCLIASMLTGIPYISSFHGVYGHKSSVKRWYNSGMLRGRHCIAVSEYVAAHIHATYPSFETPVSIINRGVDTHYFDNSNCSHNKKEALLDRWNIETNQNVLLFPARYTRLKGHALALKALAQLSESRVRLVFIGNQQGHAQYFNELKKLAIDLGVEQHVLFESQIADMREAYALSDIVLTASIKPEAFGRTIAEAQAMQRRVLTPDQGAAPEIVSAGLGQGLYQANDLHDLVRAMKAMLAMSPTDIQRQTALARQHIEEHYKLDEMRSLTIQLYRSFHNSET